MFRCSTLHTGSDAKTDTRKINLRKVSRGHYQGVQRKLYRGLLMDSLRFFYRC